MEHIVCGRPADAVVRMLGVGWVRGSRRPEMGFVLYEESEEEVQTRAGY